MTHDELERLFHYGDSSPEAVRARLIAARKAAGLNTTQAAEALGIPKQTYSSQETRGAPRIKTVRFFYRAHGIDFNYMFHGDFTHLPAPVREKLVEALLDESE